MFDGASSRLRSPAGTIFSAMPGTLSNLLNLSLNPDTDMQQLVAIVETEPAILAEFLQMESPVRLESWHQPFDRTHFLCTAAKLGMQLLQNPISIEQWQAIDSQRRFALLQSYIGENLADAIDYTPVREVKLTALLATLSDQFMARLPATSRDAIRFQHTPADSLADTQELIRIVAVTTQLAQNPKAQIQEDYLAGWGLPDANLDDIIMRACDSIKHLLKTPPRDPPAEQYDGDLKNLSRALNAFQVKTLLDQQFLTNHPLPVEIRRLGALLFGLTDCRLFIRKDDGFSCQSRLITSTNSIVTRAAVTGSIVTSADTTMMVVDQQMLEDCGSEFLLALPVMQTNKVTAVLVAGFNSPDLTERQQGLHIFAASINDAMSNNSNKISVALVQSTAKKITHEVNNPFSIVQNYLKILSLKLGDEHEAQSSINIVSSEILRAAEIIKRYNHIGDELQFQPGTADCNDVISELIAIYSRSYPDISFTKELDRKHPLLNLESAQFKQLLVNLFKNAVEAMNSHGELRIHSTADVSFPDTKYVEIEIIDSGQGINPELAGKLFASGVSSKSGGAGLGLGIVKEIMTRAGGMISFRTGSSGTSFRLLLPQLSVDSVEPKELP